MTPEMIKVIHVHAGFANLDKPAYRTVLRTVSRGRTDTCLKLRDVEFEECMAIFEGIHGDGHYWRDVWARRCQGLASNSMVWKIKELHQTYSANAMKSGRPLEDQYQLSGLCRRMFGESFTTLERLPAHQAYILIEMLKDLVNRDHHPAEVAHG